MSQMIKKWRPEEFYEKLGHKKLSALVTKQKSKAQLDFLKKIFFKKQKLLDLACGYGRLTVPLVQQGFNVQGCDLSGNLIKKAKIFAQQKNLKIKFTLVDMRELPYKDNSFDGVFCMWSSFNHMLTKKDQVKALKGMYRILKYGGICLIDVPYFKKPTKRLQQAGTFVDKSFHLYTSLIGGEEVALYLHSKQTLIDVVQKSYILH